MSSFVALEVCPAAAVVSSSLPLLLLSSFLLADNNAALSSSLARTEGKVGSNVLLEVICINFSPSCLDKSKKSDSSVKAGTNFRQSTNIERRRNDDVLFVVRNIIHRFNIINTNNGSEG